MVNQLLRIARKPSFLMTGLSAAFSALSFVVTILLARRLGVEDFGIYAQAYALFLIVRGLFAFRTSEALSRFLALNNMEVIKVTILCFAIETAGYLLGATVLFVAYGVSESEFVLYATIFSVAGVFISTEPVFDAWARHFERYAFIGGIKVLRVFLLLSLVFVGQVHSISDFLIVFALSYFVQCTVQLSMLSRFIHRHAALHKDGEVFTRQEFKGYLLKGYVANIFIYLLKNVDVLIVGKLLGDKETGIYRIAKSVTSVVSNLYAPLNFVVFRKMLKDVSLSEKLEQIRSLYVLSTKFILLLVLFSIVVLIFRVELMDSLFGDDYLGAADLLFFTFPGVIFSVGFYWVNSFMAVHNFMSYLSYVFSVSALVAIGGYIYGASEYGVVGAALMLSVATALPTILLLIVVESKRRSWRSDLNMR